MTYAAERIEKWTAAGLLMPENILERLAKYTDRHGYSSWADVDHKKALNDLFTTRAVEVDGKPRLTGAAFIKCLQSSGELPDSGLGEEAGYILWHSLCYLSTYPFPPAAATSALDGLTREEMSRALAWLLSTSSYFLPSGMQNDKVWSRTRTPNDHRRLFFQSLATSQEGADLPYDTETAKQLSWRNAQEVDQYHLFIAPNHDDQGDEIFHDLLQVLVCTQPDQRDGIAYVEPDDLLHIAHELHVGQNRKLHHLAIPRERFKALVKLLLLGQCTPQSRKTADGDGHLPADKIDLAAEAVVNAFCHVPGRGITWQMFNETLKAFITPGQSEVYLLAPIFQIIPRSMGIRSLCEREIEQPVRTTGVEQVLSPIVLAQWQCVLSQTVWLPWLRCGFSNDDRTDRTAGSHARESVKIPTMDVLHKIIINKDVSSTTVAISGTTRGTATSTRYSFAIYLGETAKDARTIQEGVSPECETTLLLQLSPTWDVFRGTIGKLAWTLSPQGIVFGDEVKGASLKIDNDLKRCYFKQNASQTDGGVFAATKWRGDWDVDLDIERLEIWREQETEANLCVY